MDENKITNPQPLTRTHFRSQFIEQFGTARRTPGAAADALALWMAENARKLTESDIALLISVGASLMEEQLEARWEQDRSHDADHQG